MRTINTLCRALAVGSRGGVLIFAAIFLALQPHHCFGSAYTNFVIVATNGQAGITGFLGGPSINNNGLCAFTAQVSGGETIYAGNGSGDPTNLTTFIMVNRSFSSYLQINDAGLVAAEDTVSGAPPFYVIREWNANMPDSFTIIDFADNGSFALEPAINNSGQVAYLGFDGSSYTLYSTNTAGPQLFYQSFLGNNLLRPMIADNGSVVGKLGSSTSSGSIRVFNNTLTTYVDVAVAGSSGQFSSLDSLPGISQDGQAVAFYGIDAGGPGVFLAIASNGNFSGVSPFRIAGSTNGFSSFATFSRVAVKTLPNNSTQGNVAYLGTQNGTFGLYVSGFQYQGPTNLPVLSPPGIVVTQGQTLSNLSGTIQSLGIQDPLNVAGTVAFYAATSAGVQAVISAPASGAVLIAPLRISLTQANVSAQDLIDAPISPVADSNVLATATTPLGLGVVADGVTPVLFKVSAPPGNYSLAMTNDATAYTNGDFSTNLFTLSGNSWSPSTNFTIASSESGVAYGYLPGLNWSDFIVLSLSNEVNVGLSVMQPNSSQALAHITFKIRPPPIALVHGYNANSSSWTPAFKGTLEAAIPSDFIIAVNYGTENANALNAFGTLPDLATLVDSVLAQQVEAPLQSQWDFTRYDVVCHSQGGVLVRMLCQDLPTVSEIATPRFGQAPVVGPQNLFRGRFRRVITIGSPHNGSLLLHYLLQWRIFNPLWVAKLPFGIGALLQPKFDPFGWQIAAVNDPFYQVNPNIKFCCISATINSGQAPTQPYYVGAYAALGLIQVQPMSGQTAGQVLLPRGSDGVVDFDSEGAGIGTPMRNIANTPTEPVNIVHADVAPWLFGVAPGQSEASDPRVAEVVRSLLNGPTDPFGAFVLPNLLSATQQMTIDSLIPASTATVIAQIILTLPKPLDDTTNYNFKAQPPANVPSGGFYAWDVELFGTNGISSDGVTLEVNTNDASQVTVTVNTNTQGSVVLYAYYAATNGTLVAGVPAVVFFQPVGTTLSGITLEPPAATLSLGGTANVAVWGNYSNGLSALLYTTNGEVTYSSSNPMAASVDSNGTITMNALGSATITASYDGLTAQTIVSAISPSTPVLSGTGFTNGTFQLSALGGLGATNMIEASDDLINWIPIATAYNSNGFIQFQDPASTNFPARFYRIVIP